MKININNFYLTCKSQDIYCDGCCFLNSHVCTQNKQLSYLCAQYNCIFLKTASSSDLFSL